MRLSDTTTKVLKNFASINPSILLNEGQTIRTISPQKNVLAQAVTDEPITDSMCLYDINQFLNIVESIDDCVINVNASKAILSNPQNTQNSTVFFADPSVIVTPPEKNINVKNEQFTFNLSDKELVKILRMASLCNAEELILQQRNDGTVLCKVTNTANPTSNDFSLVVEATNSTGETELPATLEVTKLNFIKDTYEVHVYEKIVHFQGSIAEYWIAQK
jgi:hypothetical protein|tara:strand:- start:13606 stop:14262 length:657 start_codon:yes stop_codon:yes gene_type:complete